MGEDEKGVGVEEERTIYHRASYLHHQDDHAYGSQHVLVVVQPFLHFLEAALKKKKKKRKWNKRASEDATSEIHLVWVWQRNRVAIPVHAFSRIMHLRHIRYTLGWMNYQVSKWITHDAFYMQTYGPYGEVCAH